MTRPAPPRRSPSPAATPPPRWLALVFPWLPFERLRATRGHLFAGAHATPVALVEKVGATRRIAATDPLAAAAGILPGMSLAEARALLPALAAFPHDPHADLDRLEALAETCLRYAATVAPMPPDALLAEIGDAAAFGGEAALAADLERRLARRGIVARLAFADTGAAALALARHAGAPAPDERGAVRRLPVAALDLDPDAADALAAAGLRTVGELMACSAAQLTARFGAAVAGAVAGAVRALDTAADAPPVRPLHAEHRPSAPIATADLPAIVADLAAELSAPLEARGETGRRWAARLFDVDGPVHRVVLDTDDPAAIATLVRRRVASLATGAGYDLLRLDVTATCKATPRLLIPAIAAPPPADRPPARPRRPARGAAEQPELLLLPSAPLPAQAPPPAAAPDRAWRPIHLFDPPEPLDRVVAAGDAPARFRWRRRLHEVARADGPDRDAGDWWRRGDRDAPARAYYRVEDRRGRRLWLFRTGGAAPRWYVHGVFA